MTSKLSFYNPMKLGDMNKGEHYFYLLPLLAIVKRAKSTEYCIGWLFVMAIYTVHKNDD